MSTTVSVAGGSLVYIRQNASVVEFSTNGTTWSTINFPMTVRNISTGNGVVQVLFTTDITMTSALGYFICGTNSIQFGSRTLKADGSRPLITMNYAGNDYLGLVQNGVSGVNGNSSISIVNLRLTTTGLTTLNSGNTGGWIAQAFFGRGGTNNRIINCSTDAPIATSCGGIAGAYAGNSSGDVTISGCTTSGSIGNSAGGIVGGYGGSAGGTITITNCSSSGTIGSSAGGICAMYTGYGGTATITRCFSTGPTITGGGIVGSYGAYGGTLNVSRCYSTGSIAANAGGIVADNAASFSGTVIIERCYSTGSIAVSGAGILGPNSGTTFLTTCYTSGARAGSDGGIRFGVAVDGATNYSEGNNGSSGWKDSNAAPTLGSTGWISLAANTPYEFNVFRYTPYTTTNIDTSYVAQTSASESVQQGNTTTTAGLASGFSLVGAAAGITVNATTGLITTATSVAAGTYTLTIRTTSGYSISSFVLTVTAIPPPPSSTTGRVASQSRFDENQQYITLVGGNPLLSERNSNVNSKFASYADYLRYRKAAAQPR